MMAQNHPPLPLLSSLFTITLVPFCRYFALFTVVFPKYVLFSSCFITYTNVLPADPEDVFSNMKALMCEVAWLCLPCLSYPRRRLWAAPPRCSARPSPPAHAEQSTCFLIRWRCRRPQVKTRNFNNIYLAVGTVSCYFLGFYLFVSSTLISKKTQKNEI